MFGTRTLEYTQRCIEASWIGSTVLPQLNLGLAVLPLARAAGYSPLANAKTANVAGSHVFSCDKALLSLDAGHVWAREQLSE